MTTVQTAEAAGVGTSAQTLPGLLRHRAVTQPDQVAYVFLANGEEPAETVTYAELHAAAAERAGLLARTAERGAPVVLLYPSGLEFIRTLYGCMHAGVPAAPVQVPGRVTGVERMRRIADDAGTDLVLTTAAVRDDLMTRFGDVPAMKGLTLVATDVPPPAGTAPAPRPLPVDIALLQYTSGSTADPKGVMVSHANFLGNAREIDLLWPCRPDGAVVSWLPFFHDMGMVKGIVLPLWAGIPSYLMAPEAFVRDPLRWLRAVSRFRGTHSAGPNFAFELCVRAARAGRDLSGIDLSSWRLAGNGAERVREPTVRAFAEVFGPLGFDPRAMCPCYGLAENTLKATGSRPDQEPFVLRVRAGALTENRVEMVIGEGEPGNAVDLVSTGIPVQGTRVRIVDPDTGRPCPHGRVGEIWLSGSSVAQGYWRRPAETGTVFHAWIAGAEHEGPHLRTGDLGFLHDGELYVAGRRKDLVVYQGRNFYPQDIELSVERCDPGLHPNSCAAFAVDDGTAERLVVVVEASGRTLRATGAGTLRARVRAAVHEGQRLAVDDVVVVRRGSLPVTSSGKVQRRLCRQLYLDGRLTPA